MSGDALAFWLREPGTGEIRSAPLPEPRPGDVRVRTLRSGVSRGTETLVFRGGVPPSQYDAMRAPFQEGDFPGPVKYGYLNVGVVEHGPPDLLGRTVFCLYPHQTAYVVPADAVVVVPDDVPASRAVLAGTVETAVNALWDAAPLLGDRVAVVGAGMVGCCVARLLGPVSRRTRHPRRRRRRPGPTSPPRSASSSRCPTDAAGGRDLVVHTSATSAGLQRSLDLLAPEGTVLDLSWYGDAEVQPVARAAPSTPDGSASGPARSARWPRPAAAVVRPRPAGARPRPAARPRLRRAAHRRSPASTSCPR